MTLNGQNTPLRKKSFDRAYQKNVKEGRSILLGAKCRPMILVSRNIYTVCANICRGFLDRGPNDIGVLEHGDAQTFHVKFATLKSTLLYSNMQSLVGFSVTPKCVTLNDL